MNSYEREFEDLLRGFRVNLSFEDLGYFFKYWSKKNLNVNSVTIVACTNDGFLVQVDNKTADWYYENR